MKTKSFRALKKLTSILLTLIIVVSMVTVGIVSASAAFNLNGTIYFDNSVAQWTDVYVYVGHNSYVRAYQMTPVSGESDLYSYTFSGWNNAEGFYFASFASSTSINGRSDYNINSTPSGFGVANATSKITSFTANRAYKPSKGTGNSIAYTSYAYVAPVDIADVLNGTKIMFYAGRTTSWSGDTLYVRTGNKTGTVASGTGSVLGSGYWMVPMVASAQYWISNSDGWEGVQMSGAATAGSSYMLNSTGGNNIAVVNGTAITGTSASSTTVSPGDSLTLTSTTSSNTSAVGQALTITYYLQGGSTKTPYAKGTTISSNSGSAAIDTTDMEPGEYTFIPVITDGYTYVKGDAITITVGSAVDKTALQAAITAADLLGTTNPGYTAATWTAFQSALTAAKAANTNSAATQEEVDNAATALTTAQGALEWAVTPPTNVTLTGAATAYVGQSVTLTAFADGADGDLSLSTVFAEDTTTASLTDVTTGAPVFTATAPGVYKLKLNAINTKDGETATASSAVLEITVEYSDVQTAYNTLAAYAASTPDPATLSPESYLGGQATIDAYAAVYNSVTALLTGLPAHDGENVYTAAQTALANAVSDLQNDLAKGRVYFRTTNNAAQVYLYSHTLGNGCDLPNGGFTPMEKVASYGSYTLWMLEFSGTCTGIVTVSDVWGSNGNTIKFTGNITFGTANASYFVSANTVNPNNGGDPENIPNPALWASLTAGMSKTGTGNIIAGETTVDLSTYFAVTYGGSLADSGSVAGSSVISYMVDGVAVDGTNWTPSAAGNYTISALVKDGYTKTADGTNFQTAITNDVEVTVLEQIEEPTILLSGPNQANINEALALTITTSNATSVSAVTVTSGNESTANIGGTPEAPTFTATAKGTYVLSVTATNTDGVQTKTATSTLTINVVNPNEFEILSSDSSITRGGTFTLSTSAPAGFGTDITYTFTDSDGNVIGEADQSENFVEIHFTDRFAGVKSYKVTIKNEAEETLVSENTVNVTITAAFIPGDIVYVDKNTHWTVISGETVYINLADTTNSSAIAIPETARQTTQITNRLYAYEFTETYEGTIKFARGDSTVIWNTTLGMTAEEYCNNDVNGIFLNNNDWTGGGAKVNATFALTAPTPNANPAEIDLLESTAIIGTPQITFTARNGSVIQEDIVNNGCYNLDFIATINDITETITTPEAWYPAATGEYTVHSELTVPLISSETVTSTGTATVTVNSINYVITATANPAQAGTATVDGSAMVEFPYGTVGETVKLVATVTDPTYIFINWTNGSGEVVSDSAIYTADVTGSENYTANFAKTYTVTTLWDSEKGSVTTNSETTVVEGDSVEFTATALEGYKFRNWTVVTVDGETVTTKTRTENPLTLVINANTSVTANFVGENEPDLVDKQTVFDGDSEKSVWVDTNENIVTSKLALLKWTYKVGRDATETTRALRTDTHNNQTLYTFYLPAGVDLSQIPIYYNLDALKINGIDIVSGNKYAFETGVKYETYINNGTTLNYVQFMQSDSSTMYIDTEAPLSTINQMSKPDTKGTFATAYEDGTIDNDVSALKKVKGRGNSSWEAGIKFFGKHAYNLSLDSKAKMFGMGTASKKWCLLANNVDASYSRNMLIFNLAKELGIDYTPEFKSIDLYANNEYLGTYLVTEKVELGKNKLMHDLTNIDDMNETYSERNTLVYSEGSYEFANGTYTNDVGDTISYKYAANLDTPENFRSGSFLLEFELSERYQDEASYFTTKMGQQIVIKSPEFVTQEEMEYIIERFDLAERAVYSGDYSAAAQYVDMESFIKMYLVLELSEDVDAGATSFYVYRANDADVFHAAPVWDFDWTMGAYGMDRTIEPNSAAKNPINTDQWWAKYKGIYNGGVPTTYNFQAALCQMPEFWNSVKAYWPTFYGEAIKMVDGDGYTGLVRQYADQIGASVAMNEYKYKIIQDNPSGNWGTVADNTFENAVTRLNQWITDRLTWLNDNIDVKTTTFYVHPSLVGGVEKKIYVYEANTGEKNLAGAWPGSAMVLDPATGYYKYQVESNQNVYFIITQDGNTGVRYPAEGNKGLLVTAGDTVYLDENLELHENFQVDTYTAPDVSISVEQTEVPAKSTVVITAEASGTMVETLNSQTAEPYTGSYTYELYRYIGDDESSAVLVGTLANAAGSSVDFEATVLAGENNFFVVAYPTVSDTSAGTSDTVTVTGLDTQIRLYIDTRQTTWIQDETAVRYIYLAETQEYIKMVYDDIVLDLYYVDVMASKLEGGFAFGNQSNFYDSSVGAANKTVMFDSTHAVDGNIYIINARASGNWTCGEDPVRYSPYFEGRKNIIYFDPTAFSGSQWQTNADSQVIATFEDGTTALMTLDVSLKSYAVEKGVFSGYVSDTQLGQIVNFYLDSNSNVTTATAPNYNGYIYTLDGHSDQYGSRSCWSSYNTNTTQTGKVDIKAGVDAGNSNIIFFDNSTTKWDEVWIYTWGTQLPGEDSNCTYKQTNVKMKHLEGYSDIYFYEFPDGWLQNWANNVENENGDTNGFLFVDRSASFGKNHMQTVDISDSPCYRYEGGSGSSVQYSELTKTFQTDYHTTVYPLFVVNSYERSTADDVIGDGYDNRGNMISYKIRAYAGGFYDLGELSATRNVDFYVDFEGTGYNPGAIATIQIESARYDLKVTTFDAARLGTSDIYKVSFQVPYTVADGILLDAIQVRFNGGTTMTMPIPSMDAITYGEVWYDMELAEAQRIIGYRHFTSHVKATAGGTITAPVTSNNSGFVTHNADGSYTITYALGYAVSSTAAADEGYGFIGWYLGRDQIRTKDTPTLTFTDTATSANTYVANFSEHEYSPVEVTYYGRTTSLFITKTLYVKEEATAEAYNAAVKAAVAENAPILMNVYNNILFTAQDFDNAELTYNGDRIASVKVNGTPEQRKYNIILMDKNGGLLDVLEREYQYASENAATPNPNGLVTWKAEDFGLSGDNCLWYMYNSVGEKIRLHVGKSYSFYVTTDMTLYVETIDEDPVPEECGGSIYGPTIENKIVEKNGKTIEQATFLFLCHVRLPEGYTMANINRVGVVMIESDMYGNPLRKDLIVTTDKMQEYYQAYADPSSGYVKPTGVNFFMGPTTLKPNGSGYYYITVTMTNNEANKSRYFRTHCCYEITNPQGQKEYIVSECIVVASIADYYKN